MCLGINLRLSLLLGYRVKKGKLGSDKGKVEEKGKGKGREERVLIKGEEKLRAMREEGRREESTDKRGKRMRNVDERREDGR